jgi:outer membrane protein
MLMRSLLVFLALLTTAPAQSYTFTLEKALQRALETNRQLKIARYERDRADARYNEAFSAALPQINAGASLTRNMIVPFFFLEFPDSNGIVQPQKINTGFSWQYGAAVTVDQLLYSFGKVGAALTIADYYDEATNEDFITARDNVIDQTYRVYNAVHLAKIAIRVNTFNYDLAKSNFELVEARYQAGLASEFELLQARVNMENLAPEVILARGEYERSLNDLKVVLNLPLQSEIIIADTLRILSETVNHDASEIFERSDYKAEAWRLEMFNENRSVTFADYLPVLTAQGQYQYSGASNSFERNLDLEGESAYVGVNLTVPIFRGLRTSAIYEQSVIDYFQAKLRLEQLRDELSAGYENASIRLEEARQRLVASASSRQSALKALAIAQVQRRSGAITELDFQASQLAYETSERNYYLAVVDFNLAYIELLKSVGKLNRLFDINYGMEN